MATVICDSREQKWEHVKDAFQTMGVKWLRSKLPCGDYGRMDNLSVVIDRKQSLSEVENNLIHDHERFRRECQLAQENDVKLIVLVESGTCETLEQVAAWTNPRRAKWDKLNDAHSRGKMLSITQSGRPPTDGPRLLAIMKTMAQKYGIEWQFCRHQDAGKRICELLGMDVHNIE